MTILNATLYSLALLATNVCPDAGAPSPEHRPQAWRTGDTEGTVRSRIPAPPKSKRSPLSEDGFARWLGELKLRPGRSQVHLYDGRLKQRQDVHHAVLALDVGKRDLQQCADGIMRLRAEYLWATQRDEEICFRFTSRDPASWKRWRQGWRPKVKGRSVRWRLGQAGSSADLR